MLVMVMIYQRRVGYFSNKRGFSVDSSLQGNSSNSFLWKQKNPSEEIQRNLAAENMRTALVHGCRKQTPRAGIFFFHTNLVYVFIKM